MSKYTTEVRFICENAAGLTESQGFSHVDEIIEQAAPVVFDFDFPIFDEEYRLPLEIKILRHYYTREISEETVGLWKLRLEDKLNLIMPYYNKLYNSELLQFNPFYDVDVRRERNVDTEGNENSSSSLDENVSVAGNETTSGTEAGSRVQTLDSDTTTANTNAGSSTTVGNTSESGTKTDSANRWDLYSDTPQGGVQIFGDGVDPTTGTVSPTVQNQSYLTNARNISDSSSGSHSANGSNRNEQSSTITDNGTESTDSTTNETTQNATTGNRSTTTSEVRDQDVTGQRRFTNSEDYVERVFGKQGITSYSKLLMEFRETFLNIDRMLIEELSDLFFGLW